MQLRALSRLNGLRRMHLETRRNSSIGVGTGDSRPTGST
jgi:hypothetical protein